MILGYGIVFATEQIYNIIYDVVLLFPYFN
jgi:hypothetical protein